MFLCSFIAAITSCFSRLVQYLLKLCSEVGTYRAVVQLLKLIFPKDLEQGLQFSLIAFFLLWSSPQIRQEPLQAGKNSHENIAHFGKAMSETKNGMLLLVSTLRLNYIHILNRPARTGRQLWSSNILRFLVKSLH